MFDKKNYREVQVMLSLNRGNLVLANNPRLIGNAPPASGSRIQLISPIADLRDAAERGDLAELRARTHLLLPDLKAAKEAAQTRDVARLRDHAYRLGIIGFNTSPERVINAIDAVIDIINGGVDLFVNGPDLDVATQKFMVRTEDGFVAGEVKLEAQLTVSFSGWGLGQNFQDLVPVVRLEVENSTVSKATLAIDVFALGLRQDNIELNLATQNLIGSPPTGLDTINAERSKPGVKIQRSLVYGLENVERVHFAQQGVARVNYGLDGATVGITLRAHVAGTLQNDYPFILSASVTKYGISV